MPASDASPRLLDLLKNRDNNVVDLALRLREIVREEAPDAREFVHDVKYAIALNYSFTESVKQAFCGVVIYSRHVNLGLNQGAQLHDPQKVLAGNGKGYRHIRVARSEDLQRSYLRSFIRAAIEKAQS